MIPIQLSRFLTVCLVVNAIFIGLIKKYSDEDISFMTILIKFGVPLFISEILLLFTLYPDETFDIIFGDNEFLREMFESESEQIFASTNIAHAIHSHGDIADNNLDDNNLRRRISMFVESF